MCDRLKLRANRSHSYALGHAIHKEAIKADPIALGKIRRLFVKSAPHPKNRAPTIFNFFKRLRNLLALLKTSVDPFDRYPFEIGERFRRSLANSNTSRKLNNFRSVSLVWVWQQQTSIGAFQIFSRLHAVLHFAQATLATHLDQSRSLSAQSSELAPYSLGSRHGVVSGRGDGWGMQTSIRNACHSAPFSRTVVQASQDHQRSVGIDAASTSARSLSNVLRSIVLYAISCVN